MTKYPLAKHRCSYMASSLMTTYCTNLNMDKHVMVRPFTLDCPEMIDFIAFVNNNGGRVKMDQSGSHDNIYILALHFQKDLLLIIYMVVIQLYLDKYLFRS